jgi:hypothetical protein
LDTTIVDANPKDHLFPKALRTSDSTIHVEQLVGVSCGYAGYGVTSSKDTLIISASHAREITCVDWAADFQLISDIRIVGKCSFVRFLVTNNLSATSFDTTLDVRN